MADRPSAARRGYDRRWRKVRWGVISRWLAEGKPCAFCLHSLEGSHRSTLQVDHIQRIADAPSRRFDISNLRVMHAKCHAIHTQRTNPGAGEPTHDRDGYPREARRGWSDGRGGGSGS